jgi:hypothetical protein
MPDVYGPFDGPTYGQSPWYRDRGYLEPSGVQGSPAATAAAGDLGLTAAGFSLTLGLGRAHVRGASYERTGSAWTGATPANTGTVGPRNDLLVLRRDLVAKTVVPTYLQGVAAATPADPSSFTQNEDGVWDLPLFRVQAPISSGTPLVITDLRRWIATEADTGDITFTPNTPVTVGTGGATYRKSAKVVQFVLDSTLSATYSAGFAYYTLPPGFRPGHPHYFQGMWKGTATPAPTVIGTDGVVAVGGPSTTATGVLLNTTFLAA